MKKEAASDPLVARVALLIVCNLGHLLRTFFGGHGLRASYLTMTGALRYWRAVLWFVEDESVATALEEKLDGVLVWISLVSEWNIVSSVPRWVVDPSIKHNPQGRINVRGSARYDTDILVRKGKYSRDLSQVFRELLGRSPALLEHYRIAFVAAAIRSLGQLLSSAAGTSLVYVSSPLAQPW